MMIERTDTQLQSALDAVNAFIADSPVENKFLVAAKVRGLMRGYHERWKHDRFAVREVEQVYTADLTNIDTKRKSRTFTVAGKLDAVVDHNGGTWIIDHKTTSDDIADPNAPYWRQLAIEGQVNHYMLLQWMQGIKPDGAIWDVIKKPSISPKKLTKAERAAVVSSGNYFGFAVSDDARQAMQTEERESLGMYEIRLAHDCTTERPDHYFQRRQVPRLDNELLDYARELWDHGQEVLHERNKDRLPSRNSGACMLYGSPCNFLGICSGYDTPESDKWKRRDSIHSELNGAVDGLDVLTNSRIRCFQTCRRRHYYQYELGIERVDQEEKEALWFGSLMHIALEAWFNFFKETEHDSSNNGQSRTERDSRGWATSGETQLAGGTEN